MYEEPLDYRGFICQRPKQNEAVYNNLSSLWFNRVRGAHNRGLYGLSLRTMVSNKKKTEI